MGELLSPKHCGHELLKLLETHEKLEVMWIKGKPDYIRIPFDGPMSAEEFVKLINTIESEEQRGKMNIERKGQYIIVTWERSLK